nr:zinc finger protein 544-like [Dermacentor andersoni]
MSQCTKLWETFCTAYTLRTVLPGTSKTGASSLFTIVDKVRLCKMCSYATKSSYNMVAHLRTHTGEKPYQCPHCPRAFAHPSNLRSHVFTHRYQELFKCLTCSSMFKTQNELLQHTFELFIKFELAAGNIAREWASPSKPRYVAIQLDCQVQHSCSIYCAISRLHCPFCAFRDFAGSFPSWSQQLSRSLVSVRGRVRSCRLCAYVTTASSSMTTHLRTHTGERPFRCHLCPSAFAQSANLKRHVRTHTGERPFPCVHCDASFSQKSDLFSHMRLHTGEKPYRCSRCFRLFRTQSQRASHFKECKGVPTRAPQLHAQLQRSRQPGPQPKPQLQQLAGQALPDDLLPQACSPQSADQDSPQLEPESPPQSLLSLLPTL